MAMYQKMPMPQSKDKLYKSKCYGQRLASKPNQNIDYNQTLNSRTNYSSESSDDSHDSISSPSILQTCQTQKHSHRRNYKHIQIDKEKIAQSTTDELSSKQSVATIFSNTRPKFTITRRTSKKTPVPKPTPTNNTDTYLCWNCKISLKNKDIWRCFKCKSAFYCDRKCQLRHWKIHKMECGKTITIKIDIVEQVSVADWNHYAIIYWFNRVISDDVKYTDLRKHIVVGKIKGCDLMCINKITLRMMGIHDANKQKSILNAISDVLKKDNFDNLMANRMKSLINIDIPIKYVDPVLYELMDEAVQVSRSGYIYNKSFITQYIEENRSDPITQQIADLSDIIPCKELDKEIEMWKKKHLIVV